MNEQKAPNLEGLKLIKDPRMPKGYMVLTCAEQGWIIRPDGTVVPTKRRK